jgi:choline dehydrogenase
VSVAVYVDPARRRRNFSMVTGALVRRIVIRDGAAVGVEYERRGRSHTATVRREIVLSAGAFGTPQLLQLSGVGPAVHLRSVGIDPLVDSPHVGHNLTDHPATFMNWELAPGFIGLADARNPKWLLRWLIRRSGKLTSNLMEAVAHIRSTPDLAAPDFQLIHAPIYARIDEMSYPRPALSILQSYWTPESRCFRTAAHPARQHQRPGGHGRRALRRLHTRGLCIGFVTCRFAAISFEHGFE